VAGSFTGWFSVDQAGVVFVTGNGVPTVVSDDWLVAGGGQPEGYPPGAPTTWHLSIYDRWEEAQVGIGVVSDDWAKAAWSGYWSE
jgi:hypothetical protein